MIGKADEVGADAIGMSGPAGQVHADHARQPGRAERPRPRAHYPVMLGGAALTRTYVERDLRAEYKGRLFYGKDAFEGLRTMDRLVELADRRDDDPDFGPSPGRRAGCRPDGAAPVARRQRPSQRRRAPRRWPTDNPVPVPPFLGSRVVKGIPLDDIADYLNETSLFRNQWEYRPEEGEDRRQLQGPDPAGPARAAGRGPPPTCSCRRSPTATSRPTPTATTLSSGPTRARLELTRFPFPRQAAEPLALHRRLLPARRRRASPTTRPSTSSPWAQRCPSETARLFARRPLPGLPAPARPRRSRWPRPWPSTGTGASARSGASPTRTGPSSGGPVPPAVPGRALLLGLPRLPGPRGQRPLRRLVGAERIGVECSEETVLAVPPRADHRRDHLPPPAGEVLRGQAGLKGCSARYLAGEAGSPRLRPLTLTVLQGPLRTLDDEACGLGDDLVAVTAQPP